MSPTIQVNRSSRACTILALVAILLALCIQPARADIGPKPSMTFTFVYEIPEVEVVSGVMLECGQSDCSDGAPLKELGPQHFTCQEGDCDALAYGFADYHQLVIEFADQTRESNIFSAEAFAAQLDVTVYEDHLEVVEHKNLLPVRDNCLSLSAFLTIIIEMLLALLFYGLLRLPRLVLGWVPLASLLTLPAVWYLFPQLPVAAWLAIGMAEVFAVGAEAAVFHFGSLRRVSLPRALLFSLLLNAGSFVVGMVS
ncbi:MAG: hypothetical protein HPY76_10145 [Anaerolineae bacterium]|nr:hypothetical protein [Anaerolineae bacterium]